MATPGLVEVYLSFDGNCLEALTWYAKVLGGEITSLSQWNELPQEEETDKPSEMPEPNPDWVMHASLKVGAVTLMASDNPYQNTVFGDSVTLNWSHPDAEEVQRVWSAFVESGAEVSMDLEPTFFAPLFGHLTDRFGINWQLMQWRDEA